MFAMSHSLSQSLSVNEAFKPVHTEQLQLQKRRRKQLGSVSFTVTLHHSMTYKSHQPLVVFFEQESSIG